MAPFRPPNSITKTLKNTFFNDLQKKHCSSVPNFSFNMPGEDAPDLEWAHTVYKLADENKFEEATEMVEKKLAEEPTSQRGLDTKFEVLMRQSKYDSINKFVEELIAKHPEAAALGHSYRARMYYEQRRPSDAAEEAEKSLALDANSAPTWYILGISHMHLGNLSKALKFVNRSIQLEGDIFISLVAKAQILQKMQKYDEAMVTIEKAEFLDKEAFEPKVVKMEILKAAGRIEEANEILAKLRKQHGVEEEGAEKLEVQQKKASDEDDDLVDMTSTIASQFVDNTKRSKPVSDMYPLGEAPTSEDFAERLKQAQQEKPKEEEEMDGFPEGLGGMNEKEQAKKLEELILHLKVEPNNPDLWAQRAEAEAGLGKNAEALESIDKAISIDPGFGEYYSVKSAIVADQGDHEQALKLADKAVQLDPNGAISGYTVKALALSKLGRMNEAQEALATAERFAKTTEEKEGLQWLRGSLAGLTSELPPEGLFTHHK